jgi:hypothetical protein
MKKFWSGVVAAALFVSAPLVMAADPAPPSPPAWVAESNKHAQVLLEILAKYSPESASVFGVDGFDDAI